MENFKITFFAFSNGLKKNLNLIEIVLKNYNEDRDIANFLGADVQYPIGLHGHHNNLQFLSERVNIQKVTTLHHKTYVIHISKSKDALKQELALTRGIESINSIKKLT